MRRAGMMVLTALCMGCATVAPATNGDEAAERNAAASPEEDGATQHPIAQKTGPALEPFVVKRAEGGQYDVREDLGANRVILLTFWATWCGPCKTELERMSPVFDDLEADGFQYLAVSTDSAESVSEVRPYIRSCGYEFPVLLDTTGDLIARYNPRGDLPFYVLVNRQGQVIEKHQGFKPGDEVALEKKIRSLLRVK